MVCGESFDEVGWGSEVGEVDGGAGAAVGEGAWERGGAIAIILIPEATIHF